MVSEVKMTIRGQSVKRALYLAKLIFNKQKKRLRFFYYENGKRPKLCSGYVERIVYLNEEFIIAFNNLTIGRKYLMMGRLPLKGIRFVKNDNFNFYWESLRLDRITSNIFINHIENKNIKVEKELNKFSIIKLV